MSATAAGYVYRQINGVKDGTSTGNYTVNPAKALPATTTGTLFTVTGSIVVTALVGVVSTALSATSNHVSLGVTGNNTALAAATVASVGSTTAGSVFQLPATLGAALPAPVAAQGSAAGCAQFQCNGTNITMTTDGTDTGNITWVLVWYPAYREQPGTVTAV